MPSAAAPRERRITWVVVLVCWVMFIWGNSLLAGPESSHVSGLFVTLLRPLFRAVGVHDTDLMSFVVRKCAHFTEYAVLGVLAWQNVRIWHRELGRGAWFVVALALLVPFVDEWIQLSVPGRAGMPQDVLLDLCGLVAGLLLASVVQRIFQAR